MRRIAWIALGVALLAGIVFAAIWLSEYQAPGPFPHESRAEENVSQDYGSGIIKDEDLAYIACINAREKTGVTEEIERVLKKEGITVFVEGDVVWCAEVFRRDAVRAQRVLESHPELKARGMKVVYRKELK